MLTTGERAERTGAPTPALLVGIRRMLEGDDRRVPPVQPAGGRVPR